MTNANTICKIHAWEVTVPGREGAIDSESLGAFMDGKRWDHLPIVLIEVVFADGVKGLGELYRGITLKQVIDDLQMLIGCTFQGPSLSQQPEDWRPQSPWGLDQLMPAAACASTSEVGKALEIALLDAAGRRLNCRVVDLIGGPVRSSVLVDYWCGRPTPQDLSKTIESALAGGFRGIKMKSRLGDPVVQQVEAVQRAAGDAFTITIDPMFQWLTPSHVWPVLKCLESMHARVKIEDPFPQDEPAMWRRVYEMLGLPLVWHARDPVSFKRGLQERVCDGFNASGGICGGFLQQAHTLEAIGMPCWHGSGIELGVTQAARLHAAAATPACVWPSDLVGPIIREHHLTDWDWPYESGTLPIPDRPGLGIELDQEQLKKYVRSQVTIEK